MVPRNKCSFHVRTTLPTDENLPVHQHHSLDLDMQRKLTDFNASTKPTCPSSNFEHIPHSSSFFQSGYMPSFSSVNTKDLDEEHSNDNNVTNATTDAQTLGSVELEKSNHQFLERLNYHLVSKSDGRLNNEQVQAMIALFKMISQSKEQLKKTGLQPTSLEEDSKLVLVVGHSLMISSVYVQSTSSVFS
uniref:SJCHGC04456 protein n=1 Tax=Schistosoma japonicum TaxID=6182 RepID=Q5DI23_SCHJA|nr:SJCHGC04456 protein [Schistosoma japonicum]